MKSEQKIDKTAKILLEIGAVIFSRKRPFKFDSGILSPVYVDNRLLVSFPKEREFVTKKLCELIKTHFVKAEVIAGTATAGIPHAAWISQKLKLPMVYVRSKPKNHGKKNQVEGTIKRGQKVVIVEDLISTGNSSICVANALRKLGAHVIGVAAIYSHNLKDSESNFKKAKIPFHYLTSTEKVAEVGVKIGYLKNDQIITVSKWIKNPTDWGK